MNTRIFDKRKVEIEGLPDGCMSLTPKGRVPIDCSSVEIHYEIPTGELCSVFVRGYLVDEADVRRRAATYRTGSQDDRLRSARGVLERGYEVDRRARPRTADVPRWLADLIENYRPTVPVTAGGAQ